MSNYIRTVFKGQSPLMLLITSEQSVFPRVSNILRSITNAIIYVSGIVEAHKNACFCDFCELMTHPLRPRESLNCICITLMLIRFSINVLGSVIVERSHKREIKYRMSMCFMPLSFKVQVRNKSNRVNSVNGEIRAVLFISHYRHYIELTFQAFTKIFDVILIKSNINKNWN